MLLADIAKLIGKRFDPAHAQASPRLGDVEIWRFVYERSPWRQTHPPHVHLVNFQILGPQRSGASRARARLERHFAARLRRRRQRHYAIRQL
jgi:FtsP/CotA-like multicopper oxidase with cupredoxin domain